MDFNGFDIESVICPVVKQHEDETEEYKFINTDVASGPSTGARSSEWNTKDEAIAKFYNDEAEECCSETRCNERIPKEFALKHRYAFMEMSKDEQDLVILSQLQVFCTVPDLATLYDDFTKRGSSCNKSNNIKVRNVTCYQFCGLPVCANMYFFLHDIGRTRYANLKKHFESNGIITRVNKHAGIKPAHEKALSTEEKMDVVKHIKSFDQYGLPLPDTAPNCKKLNIIRPAEDLCDMITDPTKIWNYRNRSPRQEKSDTSKKKSDALKKKSDTLYMSSSEMDSDENNDTDVHVSDVTAYLHQRYIDLYRSLEESIDKQVLSDDLSNKNLWMNESDEENSFKNSSSEELSSLDLEEANNLINTPRTGESVSTNIPPVKENILWNRPNQTHVLMDIRNDDNDDDDGDKKKRRKTYCLFCETDVLNFARHLERCHKNETEVTKFLLKPKNDPERKKIIEFLRNRGNFILNASGCIRPRRSQILPKTEKDFVVCRNCMGHFGKKSFFRHAKICHFQKGEKLTNLDENDCVLTILEEGNSLINTPRTRESVSMNIPPANENVLLNRPNQKHKMDIRNDDDDEDDDKYGDKRKRRRKTYCLFCETDVLNFARHLQRCHKNEAEVTKFLLKPKNDPERKKIIEFLRNQGNFILNASGCIRPVRSQILPKTEDDFVVCRNCMGHFVKKYFYRHAKICHFQNVNNSEVQIVSADQEQNLLIKQLTVENNLQEGVFTSMASHGTRI